ncbi:MAG: hypothetical protein ABIJ81_02055 [Patescibacteria group bacterium]
MKWGWLKVFIPLLLLLPVVWQGLISTNPIEVSTNFVKRTPWFDHLLPAGRVERQGDVFMLNAEPIYFNLRLPPRVERVMLSLELSENMVDLRLGVQQGEGWSYYFPQQLTNSSQRTVIIEKFFYAPSHRLRLIVSVPNLQSGQVGIRQVKASLMRHTFNWSWFGQTIINRYRSWIERLLAPLAKNIQPQTDDEL